MSGRDAFVEHLVRIEGVTRQEAEAFLDVVEMAREEDPRLHGELVAGLEERMAASEDGAREERAKGTLAAVASARDTRVGSGDVRSLIEAARRAT